MHDPARSLRARVACVRFALSDFRLSQIEPHVSRTSLADFRARTLPKLLLLASLINLLTPQRMLQTLVGPKSGWGVGQEGA